MTCEQMWKVYKPWWAPTALVSLTDHSADTAGILLQFFHMGFPFCEPGCASGNSQANAAVMILGPTDAVSGDKGTAGPTSLNNPTGIQVHWEAAVCLSEFQLCSKTGSWKRMSKLIANTQQMIADGLIIIISYAQFVKAVNFKNTCRHCGPAYWWYTRAAPNK